MEINMLLKSDKMPKRIFGGMQTRRSVYHHLSYEWTKVSDMSMRVDISLSSVKNALDDLVLGDLVEVKLIKLVDLVGPRINGKIRNLKNRDIKVYRKINLGSLP